MHVCCLWKSIEINGCQVDEEDSLKYVGFNNNNNNNNMYFYSAITYSSMALYSRLFRKFKILVYLPLLYKSQYKK